MNGLCNLDNVVYQVLFIIMIGNRILACRALIGRLGMEIINFPSPMSIKKIKMHYLNIIGDLKIKG